jgi:hypothetical protein
MTTNMGQVFTRADIVGAIETVKAVSSVANTVSGSGLGDLERVLSFVERAVPLFEKAASTMMQMRGFETGQRPNLESPQPYVDVEPLPLPAAPPAPAPAPAPAPVVGAPRISPIKVYSATLGALADLEKLDPDLTVAQALVMARDYKEFLLPKIEELIPSLMESSDA